VSLVEKGEPERKKERMKERKRRTMRSKQTDGIGSDGDDVDLSFPSF
jgi:hypothetical protein